MGTPHLSSAKKAEIQRQYEKTKIVTETAKRVGLKPQRVRYYLKSEGTELTGYREGVCWKNRHKVRYMAKHGASYCEIARKIGTNHHRVKEHFERYGLPYNYDPSLPENNGRWHGGYYIDKDGYMLVLDHDHPNADRHGYVRKHRKVMSDHLGRPLTDEEVVHHIDGNKQNNDISNLRLYETNGDHLRDELAGKQPKIAPENIDKLPKYLARAARKRLDDNPEQSSSSDQKSQ